MYKEERIEKMIEEEMIEEGVGMCKFVWNLWEVNIWEISSQKGVFIDVIGV